MGNTQIADNLGKEDIAYAILALLSDDARLTITILLQALQNDIGDGLWISPAEAMHITLCEIIQAKPYASDKQTIFENNENAYLHIPAEILRECNGIKVKFNKIVVSPQAISIQGKDDGSFYQIRQRLVNDLPLPDETKLPPDIVHSSIARFTKELDLETIKRIAARYSIDFEETIQEFSLIKNTTLPLLQYKVIRSYPLAKQL